MKSFAIVLISLFLLSSCQMGFSPKGNNDLPANKTPLSTDVKQHLAINGKTIELVEKPVVLKKPVLINNNDLRVLNYKANNLKFDSGKLGYITNYIMTDGKTEKQFFASDDNIYSNMPLSENIELALTTNGNPVFMVRDKEGKFLKYNGKTVGPYRDFEKIVPYNGGVAFQAVDTNDKTGIFDGTTFHVEYDDVLSLTNIGGKLAYIGWNHQGADKSSLDGESFLRWGDDTIARSDDPDIKIGGPFDAEGNLAYVRNDLRTRQWQLIDAQGRAISEEYDLIYDAQTINGKLAMIGFKGDMLIVRYGKKSLSINKKDATPFRNLVEAGGGVAMECTIHGVSGYYIILPGGGKIEHFEDSNKMLWVGPFENVRKVVWIQGQLAVLGSKDGKNGLFYQNGSFNVVPVQNMADPSGRVHSGWFKLSEVNDVAVEGERIAVAGVAEIYIQ